MYVPIGPSSSALAFFTPAISSVIFRCCNIRSPVFRGPLSLSVAFPVNPPVKYTHATTGYQMTASSLWLCHSLFLSRVSTLTRDIDIANLSVCPSVRNVSVSDENGLTYRHSFFSPYGSPIILVLPASNTFMKFQRSHPLRGL